MSFVKKVDMGDSVGECNFPASDKQIKGHIKIKKGLSPVESANTELHEILHAIAYDKGLQLSQKTEELVVSAFANGLTAFIKDNPRYFKTLMGKMLK